MIGVSGVAYIFVRDKLNSDSGVAFALYSLGSNRALSLFEEGVRVLSLLNKISSFLPPQRKKLFFTLFVRSGIVFYF